VPLCQRLLGAGKAAELPASELPPAEATASGADPEAGGNGAAVDAAGRRVPLRQSVRTVAEVFRNGQNVNLAIVSSGAAFAYRQYLGACDGSAYLGAEAAAQRQRVGVWAAPGGIQRPFWPHSRPLPAESCRATAAAGELPWLQPHHRTRSGGRPSSTGACRQPSQEHRSHGRDGKSSVDRMSETRVAS